MKLAKDVIDQQGRILIAKGTDLTCEKLRLLANHEVVSLFIEEDSQNREIAVVQDLISAATRLKLVYTIKNAFYARDGIAVHLPHLKNSVESLVEDLAARDDAFIYLNDVRVKSDYLFMHSINVGLFAIITGLKMKLPKEELLLLGMGGLLHDFGKTRIPAAILDKTGALTPDEFQQVKGHSAIGYNILKMEARVDHRILLMALQHHERCDGRGYPWGISQDEIHPLSRIVAVADVFDALTTDRVYRGRMLPFRAVQMIHDGVGSQFDEGVVAAFEQIAVPFQIGSEVQLNNGLCGNVVKLNSLDPIRPVVQTPGGMINLYAEPEIAITNVI